MPNDAGTVREMLDRIVKTLGCWGLSLEETSTVQLVMAEVLNNICEHGYPEHRGDELIFVRCAQRPDGLHVHVLDQGRGMPGGKPPLGRAPSVDVDLLDLPEGGFGWFLIKDLAKDVQYQRIGPENHLDMRIAVGLN